MVEMLPQALESIKSWGEGEEEAIKRPPAQVRAAYQE